MQDSRFDHKKLSRLDDAEIWHLLKSGDREAFDYVFSQHVQSLYAYGRKFCRDVYLVEDCIQDVFLNLWNRKDFLSHIETIKPYLLKSLRNKIIKSIAGKGLVIDKDFEIENYNFTLAFSPEEILMRKQDDMAKTKKLSLVLNKLSQKQKEVLYLKYYNHLNNHEIATVMDINYQSVRNLMHKALKSLKSRFKQTVTPN